MFLPAFCALWLQAVDNEKIELPALCALWIQNETHLQPKLENDIIMEPKLENGIKTEPKQLIC